MTAKRSALIVATSQYKDQRLATLDGPGRDAEALRTVLAHKEIGGFDVRVALNSRVDTLRRTLESFFADRARDDLLLVHFSGHGLKDDDGQLYLAAADTQIDRLLSTGIDAAWVNRLMSRCHSEKIALFLDCCFAGAFTTNLTRRVGADTAGVKENFTGSGVFVITASDAMQYSFEGGRQVGEPPAPSPFTRALVEGLETGEADRDEDGEVSMSELFDFLEDRIRRTSPSQTPTKSAFNQVGDWAIAHSTRVPSIRLLPVDLQRLLKSEDALDRFGALIDLRDLVEGRDQRMADAASQAIEKLAQDDSRRVAAAAQRLLDEMATRRAGPRSVRRQSAPIATAPAPAPVAPVLSEPTPIAAEPVTQISEAAASDPPPIETAPEPLPDAVPAPPPGPIYAMSAVPAVVAPPEIVPEVTATPPAPAATAPAATAPSPTATHAASIRPAGAASFAPPWSLRRAAARVAIGSFLWVLFQFGVFLGTNSWVTQNPDALDVAATAFGELAAMIAIYATLAVVIIERLVPAVRLPGGAAYRAINANRWVASGILGVVTGWTIGIVVESAYLNGKVGSTLGLGPEIPFCAIVGFLVAEAIVGKWFPGNRAEASATA